MLDRYAAMDIKEAKEHLSITHTRKKKRRREEKSQDAEEERGREGGHINLFLSPPSLAHIPNDVAVVQDSTNHFAIIDIPIKARGNVLPWKKSNMLANFSHFPMLLPTRVWLGLSSGLVGGTVALPLLGSGLKGSVLGFGLEEGRELNPVIPFCVFGGRNAATMRPTNRPKKRTLRLGVFSG